MVCGIPTLSLVMVLRDEADSVTQAIESVIDYVDEFVWLDTGSKDSTPSICKQYGRGIRLDTEVLGFDFGAAKTAASWMARGSYIFLLDGDETLTGGESLLDVVEWMDARNFEAVAIPRRRWADIEMKEQVEKGAYPDYQARLYRNNPNRIRWDGILHETLTVKPINRDGPLYLNHFVDKYHLVDTERAYRRLQQRQSLAKRAGVPMEGSPEAERRARGPTA